MNRGRGLGSRGGRLRAAGRAVLLGRAPAPAGQGRGAVAVRPVRGRGRPRRPHPGGPRGARGAVGLHVRPRARRPLAEQLRGVGGRIRGDGPGGLPGEGVAPGGGLPRPGPRHERGQGAQAALRPGQPRQAQGAAAGRVRGGGRAAARREGPLGAPRGGAVDGEPLRRLGDHRPARGRRHRPRAQARRVRRGVRPGVPGRLRRDGAGRQPPLQRGRPRVHGLARRPPAGPAGDAGGERAGAHLPLRHALRPEAHLPGGDLAGGAPRGALRRAEGALRGPHGAPRDRDQGRRGDRVLPHPHGRRPPAVPPARAGRRRHGGHGPPGDGLHGL